MDNGCFVKLFDLLFLFCLVDVATILGFMKFVVEIKPVWLIIESGC